MADPINLYSKTGFYHKKDEKKDNIFSNMTTVMLILGLALLFIGYVAYLFFFDTASNIIQSNSSYYGTDIALYEPIFQQTTSTITDCVNLCTNDLICDGITYNNNTQTCTGTKGGQIRNETAAYSAWVKPVNITKVITTDFKKAIIVGFTNTARQISGTKISKPYMLGNFCYSFNLTIYDFYKNYGSWRHIFHKGTAIDTNTILDYQSWENLIKDIPTQVIGVWLAPFSNNLRIAVTTTSLSNRSYGSYPNAFVEKCNDGNGDNNCFITDMPSGKWTDRSRMSDGTNPKTKIDTYIEYFDQDLQNIPINTQVNIIINFRNTHVEIYFNGKILKITQLDGTPIIDNSNLYVLNDKTANCEISNLLYYPDIVKLGDVKQIINIAPAIE